MAADYGDQAKYKANPYNIDKDKVITAAGMRTALGTKEDVENKVDALPNNIDSTKYPSTKLIYNMFPIGTVLMFHNDSRPWTDDVTIPGWYACCKDSKGALKSVNGVNVPDLENKFIRGKTSGSAVAAGAAASHQHSLTNAHSHGANTSFLAYSATSTLTGLTQYTLAGTPSTTAAASVDNYTSEIMPAHYHMIFIMKCSDM